MTEMSRKGGDERQRDESGVRVLRIDSGGERTKMAGHCRPFGETSSFLCFGKKQETPPVHLSLVQES